MFIPYRGHDIFFEGVGTREELVSRDIFVALEANTWRKFCRSFEQKELASMETLWRAFSKYLGQDKVFKLERMPDNFLTFASKTYTERMDWYRSKSFQSKFIWPTEFSMVSWSLRKFAYTWNKLCLWISGLGLCFCVRSSSFYYTPVVSGNQ